MDSRSNIIGAWSKENVLAAESCLKSIVLGYAKEELEIFAAESALVEVKSVTQKLYFQLFVNIAGKILLTAKATAVHMSFALFHVVLLGVDLAAKITQIGKAEFRTALPNLKESFLSMLKVLESASAADRRKIFRGTTGNRIQSFLNYVKHCPILRFFALIAMQMNIRNFQIGFAKTNNE